MSEIEAPSTPRRPRWADFRLTPTGGVRVRIWFRQLVSDFWGKVLRPYYFHTWLEIVDSEDRPAPGRPLAVGIYSKDTEHGSDRATVMQQSWEYEDAQVERFGSGYMLTTLPTFDEADFDRLVAIVHDDIRLDRGPYAYLSGWARYFGDDSTQNCMTWIESIVRDHGGEHDILEIIEGFYRRHIDRPRE